MKIFFEKAASASRGKFLTAAAAAFLPLVLLALYHIFPQMDRMKKLRADIALSKTGLSIAKARAGRLEGLRMKNREARKMVTSAPELLPGRNSVPRMISTISGVGGDSGLEFLFFSPLPEAEDGRFMRVPVEMGFSGRYPDVVRFFKRMANHQYPVNMREIKMERWEGSAGVTVRCIAETLRPPDGEKNHDKNQ